MKRNNWKFEYTGRSLMEAAQKRLEHREERVKVWTERMTDIMSDIKSRGLTVDEGNARVYTASNNVNSFHQGPTVVVDHQLQKNLAEAHSKVNQHQAAVRDYSGWVKVFEAHPDQTFKLNHDDWLHFFGE